MGDIMDPVYAVDALDAADTVEIVELEIAIIVSATDARLTAIQQMNEGSGTAHNWGERIEVRMIVYASNSGSQLIWQ
jgi:hypothetical protein